jgi:hypothetical protein
MRLDVENAANDADSADATDGEDGAEDPEGQYRAYYRLTILPSIYCLRNSSLNI